MTPTTWVVDGVTLYGYDAGLDKLLVRTMDGPNDGAPARQESVPRPLDDGDFPAPVTRGPKLITAAGWCRCTDEAAMLALRNELMAIFLTGEEGELQINEFGVTRLMTVTLYGTPTFRRQGNSLRANWSLMLRSADGRITDDFGLHVVRW